MGRQTPAGRTGKRGARSARRPGRGAFALPVLRGKSAKLPSCSLSCPYRSTARNLYVSSLAEKEKAAIERGLNQGGGAPEVTVKVENGKVVVLKVKKEKIFINKYIINLFESGASTKPEEFLSKFV